jgi:adenosylcobinamide kinase/adenosylcobinamide-phosphate guanylyltransferase
MPITLVLGGARSGKSSYAEEKVKFLHQDNAHCSSLHYVATAIAFDDEMALRIAHHQQRRGHEWIEHHIPVNLTQKLDSFNDKDVVLVDCLTVWLNNLIYNNGLELDASQLALQLDEMVERLKHTQSNIVLVANEVGFGVVPLGKETRLFVDHAGWLNQKIAKIADNVVLVVAGIPIALKGNI